jgi:hypothetical protein
LLFTVVFNASIFLKATDHLIYFLHIPAEIKNHDTPIDVVNTALRRLTVCHQVDVEVFIFWCHFGNQFEYKLGLSRVDMKRKILISGFIDEWLEFYSQTQVKIKSIRIREHQSSFMKKYFCQSKLKDINNQAYQDFLFYLKRERKLADRTISGIHGTNRMIFKRALQQHLIFTNPSDMVYIRKRQKQLRNLKMNRSKRNILKRLSWMKFSMQQKRSAARKPILYFLLYLGQACVSENYSL